MAGALGRSFRHLPPWGRVIPPPRPMTDPGNAPAVVLTCGRRAVVLHPDGSEHENAVATVRRLERRGYMIVPLLNGDSRAAFLAAAPAEVRAAALACLARLQAAA